MGSTFAAVARGCRYEFQSSGVPTEYFSNLLQDESGYWFAARAAHGFEGAFEALQFQVTGFAGGI